MKKIERNLWLIDNSPLAHLYNCVNKHKIFITPRRFLNIYNRLHKIQWHRGASLTVADVEKELKKIR